MINRDSFYGAWSRRIDWPTMGAMGILLAIGLVAVFSAVNPSGASLRFMLKQLGAISLGVFLIFVFSTLNYQIFRAYPWVIYGMTVFALAAVLIIGRKIHGAKSWIVFGPLSIEPVELARIGFILVIAALLDHPELEMRPIRWMTTVFGLGAVHMALILKEPYLGGTLVYGPIMLAMLYFAGVPSIYLLAVIFFGAVAVGIPIISTYFSMQPQLLALHPFANFLVSSASGTRSAIELLMLSTSIIFGLWWFIRKLQIRLPWQYPGFLSLIVAVGVYTAHLVQHVIKDYQRKRIVVFLSPGFDPLGSGYHILQSQIAIGSGRLFGKGLFSGSQTQLGFLPEKHTDFIFSVIGEEMGFFWSSMVIIAFGVLVWRAFVIATESQDRFGSLIAVGVGCLFAFQCVMNIGMTLGLLPVTGVALPFVSYGGSQVVSAMIAIGLLQSVNFRRYIY
jgi:rod shape determining protein RodA